MSKRESISRYNLIIKKLRRFPASFDEIQDYLARESEMQGYDFNISKRTFQRDLNDIRSLFNIDIQYDTTRKAYFIDDEGQEDVSDRMLEAFDTFSALNVADGLAGHIHFEKRRPQGTQNLHGLLHAIKNRFQIVFSYEKFWEEEKSKRNADPYALKEFKNRWYVLAKDHKDDKIKSFALDRLTELDITKRRFERPDYNVNEAYRYSFGIISPNDMQPHEIILSLTPFQGKYIKSLPLHDSQEIMVENDKELRVSLRLFITHDFIMELLSLGENVKVIKPKSLAKEIKEAHQMAVQKYPSFRKSRNEE